MDFSVSSLAAGFVFGVLGLYLLRWSRKSGNFYHLFLGLALMAYPYFVSGAWMTWGLGAALTFFAYLTRNA